MKPIVVFYVPVGTQSIEKVEGRLQEIKNSLPSDLKEECWTFVLPTKSDTTKVEVFNPRDYSPQINSLNES